MYLLLKNVYENNIVEYYYQGWKNAMTGTVSFCKFKSFPFELRLIPVRYDVTLAVPNSATRVHRAVVIREAV
jgi:hypothetical protein